MKLSRLFRKAVLTLTLAFATAVAVDSGARFATRPAPRPLTEADIKIAESVFGNTIDYSKVRISYQRISFLQPPQTIMTLGNVIYWPGERKTVGVQRTFVHEMGHIWQNQNNIKNTGITGAIALWAKKFAYKKEYAYQLDSTKKLTDYNMEQQAEIISDYYALKAQHKPAPPSVPTSLPCESPVDSLTLATIEPLPPAPPKDQLGLLKDIVEGSIKNSSKITKMKP